MVNKLISIMLISILFFGCTNATDETEKKDAILLRLNVKKDDVYKMQYTLFVHNDTTGDETKFSIDILNKIEDAKNDKIEVSSLFESISMHATLKGKEIDLTAGDTIKSDPEASLVAAPVFAFLKHNVVSSYSNTFKKLSEKIQDADTVKALVDVESKAQFIAQYPEKEIGINDSWESAISIKVGNQQIDKAVFVVKSISDKEVLLTVNGKIDGKGEKFGHEFTMKGDFTGEISVDKLTGWQNKSALHIQFVLEMMGNKTPMKQEITYSLK